MIAWSLLAGVVGLLGTWTLIAYRARRQPPPGPIFYWVLGLAALLPTWLIGFLGLLGSPLGERPEEPLAIGFILSSSAALLGLIVTDAVVRRLRDSGHAHPPITYWLLGVAALAPAWGIALLILWIRP